MSKLASLALPTHSITIVTKTRVFLLSCLTLGLLGIASTIAFSSFLNKREIPFKPSNEAFIQPVGISGTLLLSSYQRDANKPNPLQHEFVFVNGPTYTGMEDNDMRGYLDGAYKHRWNQSGQVHVRIGRRGKFPRYGEYELFRILQRWTDIHLPAASNLLHARLTLTVEKGPSFPVHIYLYDVKKDWDPGSGGHRHDNNSRPNKGEVWWEEVAHKEERWALPGAGFSSDTHSSADISALPLAMSRYMPGRKEITFSSPELVAYIASRLGQDEPLLFLMKLSNVEEDLPGTRLHLYSSNYGDSHSFEQRPRLYLRWENSHESQQSTKRILMEYGKSYTLPRIEIRDAEILAASFVPEAGSLKPTLLIRGGNGEQTSAWEQLKYLYDVREWNWIEIQLLGATRPVSIEKGFTSQIRDTWITSGPPMAQEVLWTFVSPSGKKQTLKGEYRGNYTWAVHFQPDELGQWRYSWQQHFTSEPHTSEQQSFDVLVGDPKSIERQLEILLGSINSSTLEDPDDRMRFFEMRFLKLERAAMNALAADHISTTEEAQVRSLLKKIRVALQGDPLPSEPIAFRDHSRTW